MSAIKGALLGLLFGGCAVSPTVNIEFTDAGVDNTGTVLQAPLLPPESGLDCWNANRKFETRGNMVIVPDPANGIQIARGVAGTVVPNHRITVTHRGLSCGPACEFVTGTSAPAVEADGTASIRGSMTVLPRTGVTQDDIDGMFNTSITACANANGLTSSMGPVGLEITLPARRDNEQGFTENMYWLVYCLNYAVLGLNTFDGTGDLDQDQIDDTCDNCPEVANVQEDTDEDGLGDACDCHLSEVPLENECSAPNGHPGRLECPEGSEEPFCNPLAMTWADYDSQELLGGLLSNGPQADAPLIPYELRGVVGGAVVAGPSANAGADYERWVCRQILNPARGAAAYALCVENTLPGTRPRYTTVAGNWSLPATLNNSRAHPVILTENRIRYPDYLIAAPAHTVIGEAKCYRTVPDIQDSGYWWARFVAFGTQFTDYINKAAASRRGGTRTSVHYHYCRQPPRWAAEIMVLGMILVDSNEFNEQSLGPDPMLADTGISDPMCWEGLAVVDALFNCYVPGEANPLNLESCIGAWYDSCKGSE